MWQRFTEYARKAVFYSQQEARNLGHAEIDASILLLGVLDAVDCEALAILRELSIDIAELRRDVEQAVGRGDKRDALEMLLAMSGKMAIDLGYQAARHLKDNYIGTEHLLMGIVAEEESHASKLLIAKGATRVELKRIAGEFRKQKRREKDAGPKAAKPEKDAFERVRKAGVASELPRLLLITRQNLSVPRLLLLIALADADGGGSKAFKKAVGPKSPLLHMLLERKLLEQDEEPSQVGADDILAHAASIATQRGESLGTKHLVFAIHDLRADPYFSKHLAEKSLEDLMRLVDEDE